MLSYGILPIPRALCACGALRRSLPAALLLITAVRSVVAQVGVRGDRDLTFGTVTRGLPATVAPTDPIRSGQWTLTSTAGSRVQIRVTAPTSLSGPGGATMPIVFGKNDAFIQPFGGIPQYFNAGATVVFVFGGGSTSATLRLGGRVIPAASQTSGSYSNTVLLTMTVLN